MSLEPMPDAATLLRMKAQREGRIPTITIETRLTSSQPQPITLRIPWSALVSDNDKFVATMRKGKPSMVITSEYATAKTRIQQLATDMMGGRPPFACPVRFLAQVWYPSNHPRDLTNWAKLVQDGLAKIVYEDDRWIHDARWLRMGIDVDAPHALVTLSPL